ncbi:MAG: hypothetical protein L6V35_05855 [Alistipes putredinis]|nr:MAG: hypothetical protein L6V35_05855 [Alistipes putredinis]
MLKPKGIKRRVAHAVLYGKSLTHIKHYRGFGVHSPFVYGLIRNVFMCKYITGSDTELYEALLSRGVSQRRARQLQNMMNFCAYKNYVIADEPSDRIDLTGQTLCLVTRNYPQESTEALAEKGREDRKHDLPARSEFQPHAQPHVQANGQTAQAYQRGQPRIHAAVLPRQTSQTTLQTVKHAWEYTRKPATTAPPH